MKTFTCTAEGYTDPKATKTEEIPMVAHTYEGDGTVTTVPTCAAPGVKTKTCTVCHKTVTEEVAKLTYHSYQNADGTMKNVAGSAEIVNDTNHKFTCTICGESKTAEHTLTAIEDASDGKECKVCGYKVTITGETPTGHEHVFAADPSNSGNKAATCKEAGVVVYKCTAKVTDESGTEKDCTATKTETIAKLPHTWSDWTEDEEHPGTCTIAAVLKRTCTVAECGATETKNGELNPEKHTEETIAAKDATCTEAGNKAGVQCTACKKLISGGDVIPALGHSYDNGVITEPATCIAAGMKTFTCTRTTCTAETTGHTKTENIPATGKHAAATDATWEKDNTKHWHVCATEGCTAKVDEADHVFGVDDKTDCECGQAAPTQEVTTYTIKVNTICETSAAQAHAEALIVGTTGSSEPVTKASEGETIRIAYGVRGDGYSLEGGGAKGIEVVGAKGIEVVGADGKAVDVTENTFTMPASDVTVTVTIVAVPTQEPTKYTVTLSSTGSKLPDGCKIETDKTTAAEGETVKVTITYTNVYQVKTVTVGTNAGTLTVDNNENTKIQTATFTMPANDVTVTVEFEQVYAIVTASPESVTGGIISIRPSAAEGKTVTFDVCPADGYQLKADTLKVMNGDTPVELAADSSKTNRYTFTMPANTVTVTAEFEAVYGVKVDPTITGGKVTAKVKGADSEQDTEIPASGVPAGTVIVLSATPDTTGQVATYTVTYTTGDNSTGAQTVTVNADNTFTMPAGNVTVTATFAAPTATPETT